MARSGPATACLPPCVILCFLSVVEMRGESSNATDCKGRADQIGGIWASFREAGMRCHLELGRSADECNLFVRVQEDLAIGEEMCFVPEDLLLRPYVVSPSETEDSRLLASRLQTAFSKHGVCDSRSALAVRLILEGQRRCDCMSQKNFDQSKCSMWTCLLPERFSSALEFNKVSIQLLDGTSARGPLKGLQAQYDNVRNCLDKLDFFPAGSAPTVDQIAWGFNGARTRGSGSDKDDSLINPITVMFNYHPNISMGQVFAFRESGPGKIGGEIMRAKFDLKRGDEIFYKYGDFTNAELLVLYGFVIPTSVAENVDMSAIRIFVDGWTVPDVLEQKPWHADAAMYFNKLRCNNFMTLALGFDGRLVMQHSRIFPACAGLHYLSTSESNPGELNEALRRIKNWPPVLEEKDTSFWHALVAHQWSLLAEVCGKELQKLDETIADSGLMKDSATGALSWPSLSPWEEDQRIKEAVLQVLKDEVQVFASCKKHALEIAQAPMRSGEQNAKRVEL